MEHAGIQRIQEALRVNSNVDWEHHGVVGGGEAAPVAHEVGEEGLGREDRADLLVARDRVIFRLGLCPTDVALLAEPGRPI